MTQFYSDPAREGETYALPDCEVFYVTKAHLKQVRQAQDAVGQECMYSGPGWYYWACFPGCLPDSDPIGPFKTEEEAIEDARENMGP